MVVWSLGVVAIFAVWRLIASRISRSEAVAAAVALVEANPEARTFLGAPVQGCGPHRTETSFSHRGSVIGRMTFAALVSYPLPGVGGARI